MKKKTKNYRWRLFADWKIQGRLCARLAIYWVVCQFAMIGTILGFAFITDSSGTGEAIIPAFIVSTLVLPIMMFDMVVFSNRFAGPMLNFRRKMKQLAETNLSEKIEFRDGDFYQELRDSFNELREKIISSSAEQTDNAKSGNRLPPLEIKCPPGTQSHV